MKSHAAPPVITLADAEAQFHQGAGMDESDLSWSDPFLDDAVGPLTVGGLYTFAARKGTGKSFSLLRQLLLLPVPTLFVSCEDPLREVGRRVSVAPVEAEAKERVSLLVPERPKLGLITAAMRKYEPRVVAVDYLQVLQDDTGVGTFDRMGQIRNILVELKATARLTGSSVLLAAQLKRPPSTGGAEDGNDAGRSASETRGTIYDIRDSSDVENVSEAVILVHRLGRTRFDQTVAAVKSRLGGERRTFERGNGGWPLQTASVPASIKSAAPEHDPFGS